MLSSSVVDAMLKVLAETVIGLLVVRLFTLTG
jgi:hypothetical protein